MGACPYFPVFFYRPNIQLPTHSTPSKGKEAITSFFARTVNADVDYAGNNTGGGIAANPPDHSTVQKSNTPISNGTAIIRFGAWARQ